MILASIIPWWFYPLFVWTVTWRIIACWQAAKRNHLYWFVLIFVFNTLGILPILYLVFFKNVESLKYLDISEEKYVKPKPQKK